MMIPRLCVFLIFLTPMVLRSDIFADFTLSYENTPIGTFRVKLFPEEAPRTVANFVGLASGHRPWLNPNTNRLQIDTPYYDGLIFHRLIHHFVIQGGDPVGNGSGGPGYVFQDEFHPDLRHDRPYLLSMANSGFNTNGSQFFITLAPSPGLDDMHSIFGEVINGRDIIDGFMDSDLYPTNSQNRPIGDIKIESVILSGSGLENFLLTLNTHDLPKWKPVALSINYVAGNESDNAKLLMNLATKERWDYYFILGNDLINWPNMGVALSLGNNENQVIDFTDATGILNGAPRGFIQVYALDYSQQVQPPSSIFTPGTTVNFTFSHGLLSITFGTDALTSIWTYTPITGEPRNGNLTDKLENPFPTQDIFWGQEGRTLAPFLLRRTVRLFFSENIVPEWDAMEPTLSFHTESSGWFREISFGNQDPLPGIQGTFTIEFP